MTLLWTAFVIFTSSARGPIGDFVNVATGLEPLDKRIGYAESRIEKRATSYQETAYQSVDRRLHGGLSAGEKWAVAPDVRAREVLSDARIPTKDRPLPSQLYDARMKLSYRSRVGVAGFGAYLELGQNTDKPLKDIQDGVYNISTYAGFGPEPRSSFLIFVNFANDRPILNHIPIPGFALSTRLSPRWGATFGFPHSGLWAVPFDWLKFDLSMEPLLHLDARLTVSAGDIVDVYFSAISTQETYRRSGRASYKEQIIYSGQELSVGLSKKSGPLLFELSGGLGMNRSYIETSDYLTERKAGLLRIANGLVGQARVRVGF
jgi:hypothetical protein